MEVRRREGEEKEEKEDWRWSMRKILESAPEFGEWVESETGARLRRGPLKSPAWAACKTPPPFGVLLTNFPKKTWSKETEGVVGVDFDEFHHRERRRKAAAPAAISIWDQLDAMGRDQQGAVELDENGWPISVSLRFVKAMEEAMEGEEEEEEEEGEILQRTLKDFLSSSSQMDALDEMHQQHWPRFLEILEKVLKNPNVEIASRALEVVWFFFRCTAKSTREAGRGIVDLIRVMVSHIEWRFFLNQKEEEDEEGDDNFLEMRQDHHLTLMREMAVFCQILNFFCDILPSMQTSKFEELLRSVARILGKKPSKSFWKNPVYFVALFDPTAKWIAALLKSYFSQKLNEVFQREGVYQACFLALKRISILKKNFASSKIVFWESRIKLYGARFLGTMVACCRGRMDDNVVGGDFVFTAAEFVQFLLDAAAVSSAASEEKTAFSKALLDISRSMSVSSTPEIFLALKKFQRK